VTQLYVVTSAQSSSSTPECECLAHRFGNAADHPDRRPCYGTDMTDAEWVVVRAALPVPAWMDGRGGRPEGYCHRQMIDAIRYLVDNGTKWRNLPADFPPWKRVYAFFRRWRDNALIREFHDRLRDRVRTAEGRNTEPTAAVMDSQSVKADATVKNDSRGFDGGKKINGRKRHLIVDCLGLLLMVLVTPASTTDRDAADAMLPILRAGFRKLRLIWADSGYTGHLIAWAARTLDLILQVVKRSDDSSGFTVLPRRWVVERSLAWLMRSRRLARDYETCTASSEAMIWWSMTMVISRRLARRSGTMRQQQPVPARAA
jgi:transposase